MLPQNKKDAALWHESGMKEVANQAPAFTNSIPRRLFALANHRQIYKVKLLERRTNRDSALWIARLHGFSGDSALSKIVPAMQSATQERRLMRRFDMRLPALVRLEHQDANLAGEFETETQNVSARGVFFYLDHRVPAGTRCEVTLTFPPHITLTDAVRVRFTARVIRSDSPSPSSRVGTAAMIEDYEFLRSGGSSSFLSALQQGWKAPN